MALAEAWAGRCEPPLDDWQKHVRGIIAKEGAKCLRRTPAGLGRAAANPGREGTNSQPEPKARAESPSPELIPSLPCQSDGPSPELIPSFPGRGREQEAEEAGVLQNAS